jgi:hypothetical protein
MTVQKFAPDGFELAIYAEEANLNYFLTTPLTPASVGAVVSKESSVKTFPRRQYKGDPTPVNVDAHTRVYMLDPGRKVGNALPGEPFILDDGTEKRQMTFAGNVVDLHAFLLSDVKKETKLYTTGARYVIPKPTAG